MSEADTPTTAAPDPVRVAREAMASWCDAIGTPFYTAMAHDIRAGKSDDSPAVRDAILGARAMQEAMSAQGGGEVVAWQWRYRSVRPAKGLWSDWQAGRAPNFSGNDLEAEERPLYARHAPEVKDAPEVGKWDHRYRPLKTGEIIRAGDECLTDSHLGWQPAKHCIGEPAPDPAYTSHRMYRRLKEATPAPAAADELVERTPPFSTYPADRGRLLELARRFQARNVTIEESNEAAGRLSDLVIAILEDEAYGDEHGVAAAGASDAETLVQRLRQYEGQQSEVSACYNGLRDEAAARIEAAAAEVWQLRVSLAASEAKGAEAFRLAVHHQGRATAAEAERDALSGALQEIAKPMVTNKWYDDCWRRINIAAAALRPAKGGRE